MDACAITHECILLALFGFALSIGRKAGGIKLFRIFERWSNNLRVIDVMDNEGAVWNCGVAKMQRLAGGIAPEHCADKLHPNGFLPSEVMKRKSRFPILVCQVREALKRRCVLIELGIWRACIKSLHRLSAQLVRPFFVCSEIYLEPWDHDSCVMGACNGAIHDYAAYRGNWIIVINKHLHGIVFTSACLLAFKND